MHCSRSPSFFLLRKLTLNRTISTQCMYTCTDTDPNKWCFVFLCIILYRTTLTTCLGWVSIPIIILIIYAGRHHATLASRPFFQTAWARKNTLALYYQLAKENFRQTQPRCLFVYSIILQLELYMDYYPVVSFPPKCFSHQLGKKYRLFYIQQILLEKYVQFW